MSATTSTSSSIILRNTWTGPRLISIQLPVIKLPPAKYNGFACMATIVEVLKDKMGISDTLPTIDLC